MANGSLRIGTAEREQAVAELGEHFAAGRLDADEYAERVGRAFQARFDGDLAVLFTDLPRSAPPVPVEPRHVDYTKALRVALVVLLVAGCVAWVRYAPGPPFFLFPLVWLFVIRGIGRRGYR